jgi:hypothetical protein
MLKSLNMFAPEPWNFRYMIRFFLVRCKQGNKCSHYYDGMCSLWVAAKPIRQPEAKPHQRKTQNATDINSLFAFQSCC